MNSSASFVLLLSLLLACAGPRATIGKATDDERAAPGVFEATQTSLSDRGQRFWSEHLAASTTGNHQPVCAPKRFAPPGSPKGLVVLFHGFTACPDQYDQLAPLIAAEGYEVLVPLLPGHGRQPPATPISKKLVDDVTVLPTRHDWERYRDFAESWADVLAEAKGEHIVAGFSLGGTVAAFTVTAHPTDIDRALLIAPFFSLSNTFAKAMLGVAAGVDALLTTNPIDPMENHWGPSCEVERQGGRGGYCSFLVNHVAAAQLSGVDARARLAKATWLPPLQLVAIENDAAVDGALATATIHAVASKSPDARVCTFSSAVPHSFFSPHDQPQAPKPWLKDFLAAEVDFLARGKPFPRGACPGNP